jgi:N6-adenosine-specific RNA methylase IME4
MIKKYSVILADCPWQYKVWSKKGAGRSAENHYPTMNIEDICALPVSEIAETDAALFLWATFPNLLDALKTINAWGFKYKTCAFTWVKRNKLKPSWFWGLGYWTRANAELVLLATRGNIRRVSAAVHQVVDTPVERHSKKPDVVRERIVELMGDIPRIELFARDKADGWDVWGNEVESDIKLEVKQHG